MLKEHYRKELQRRESQIENYKKETEVIRSSTGFAHKANG